MQIAPFSVWSICRDIDEIAGLPAALIRFTVLFNAIKFS